VPGDGATMIFNNRCAVRDNPEQEGLALSPAA
jgi:hypothetical protein